MKPYLFVAIGFHDFGNISFEKNKSITFLFFLLSTPSLISEKSLTTLSVFKDGAIKHFKRGKIRFTASTAFSINF